MNNEQTNKLICWYKNFILTRKIYFSYDDIENITFLKLLKDTRLILLNYNATFSYEKKGNKREGALTFKKTKNTDGNFDVHVKTIKIRKDISFVNQAHTYFHELGHLVNYHTTKLSYGNLSHPQKEYVAETISQALLFSFFNKLKIESVPSNKKWEQETYIYNWIKNAKFSEQKIVEMKKQIEAGYEYISQEIIFSITNN